MFKTLAELFSGKSKEPVPAAAHEDFTPYEVILEIQNKSLQHRLKLMLNHSKPNPEYVIDDRRYGIDSPDYLFIQRYMFTPIDSVLTLAYNAEEARDSLETLKDYGNRIALFFKKIDTRPKTLYTTVTFGIFCMVRTGTLNVELVHYADLTVPKEICWSADGNEFHVFRAHSVTIIEKSRFRVSYVSGDATIYRYTDF